jgi:very-short-patch-repair endonuclease
MTDMMDRLRGQLRAGLDIELAKFACREDLHSPIERIFAASLSLRARLHGASVGSSREAVRAHPNAYFLEPQVQIGAYRVDFLLGLGEFVDDMSKAVVVECDGHEWHERTKAQATADKSRDRVLSLTVGKVIRFTGSEIWEDPGRCSIEAVRVLNALIGEPF